MPYSLDKAIDLRPSLNKSYIISSLHRKRSSKKTFWTVPSIDEVECFKTSQIKNWTENNLSWGIISTQNIVQKLGINSQREDLKIAKFIDGNNNDIWHGYPADYVRNNQDRPNTATLIKWHKEKIILKHQIIKIRQGKECGL